MNKKLIVLISSIIVSIIILISSTYALLFKTNVTEEQSYKTGVLEITSTSVNNSVTLTNSLPTTDEDGAVSTPYTFKITNTGNLSYKFDVMLLSTTTDNQIDAQYIKVKVDNETTVTLNNLTDGKIKTNVTLKPGKDITISLRVWLSDTTPNTQIGKTFNGKITTDGQAIYTVENTTHAPIDNSGANYPDLIDGLIPVVYNETTKKWVKADTESSTSTYGWYDYANKKWANAVLVTDTNRSRSTYQNATAGTEITDSDILAFYVWIPRYKYKVWNKDKVVGTDSCDAQNMGVGIVFESGTASTGEITCTNYSFAAPSSTAGSPNETCTGENGNKYTHPAFTFGDNEVRGFWIGKYELSSETPTATDGGGSSTTLTARILPNVNSWRNNNVSNFSTVIQNMQASNNIYGLSTDKSTTDSHMLTNMEWGAVAYLTHSAFGRCYGTDCTEVTINNCSTYVTGIGADAVSASRSSTTCTTDANKYNGAKGVLASTTGNVYGVYDMSGGAYEYVMGNMSSTADTYTFYSRSAGFASSWYNDYSNQKYVNTYANGTTGSDQSAYNRGRLGDATGEVVLSTGGTGGWYNDYAYFPYSSYPWFVRGGNYSNGSIAGVLGFNNNNGNANSYYSARAALVWFDTFLLTVSG
mgnify:CR=1 FL=1